MDLAWEIERVDKKWEPGKGTPTDHMIMSYDSPAATDEAVKRFEAAGFTEADIVSLHGQEGYDLVQRAEGSNPLKQLFYMAINIEGEHGREDALDELRHGHSLLFVHAPDEDQQEQAVQLAKDTHAHNVSYRGMWTTTTNLT